MQYVDLNPADMTPEQIIARVHLYQNTYGVHTLVCSYTTSESHGPLVPIDQDGKVHLVCSGCDFIRHDIPMNVFSFIVDIVHSSQEFMKK